MTEPASPLVAKWLAKFAETRKELEERAARGDLKARAILIGAGIPVPPPPNHHDREPGED